MCRGPKADLVLLQGQRKRQEDGEAGFEGSRSQAAGMGPAAGFKDPEEHHQCRLGQSEQGAKCTHPGGVVRAHTTPRSQEEDRHRRHRRASGPPARGPFLPFSSLTSMSSSPLRLPSTSDRPTPPNNQDSPGILPISPSLSMLILGSLSL